MLAEAFRQPGERMPIAGFGLIGLVGAAFATVFLWDSDAQSFGVVRSDNFALFINLVLCVVGVLTMLFSDEIVEREKLPPGEYDALTLFGHQRHDVDGRGVGPAGDLPRARSAVAFGATC